MLAMDLSNDISPCQLEKPEQEERQQQFKQQHYNPTILRQVKIDDIASTDTVSTYSRGSHSGTTSARSGFADAGSNLSPVSVRDMIRRYNSVSEMEKQSTSPSASPLSPQRRQSQYTLSSAKSSFSGVNKLNSQTLLKRESSDDDGAGKTPPPSRYSCRRCSSCKFYEPCVRAPMASASDRYCCRSALRGNSSGGESENSSCPAFTGASMNRKCSFSEPKETKEVPTTVVRNPAPQKGRCVKTSSIDTMEEAKGNPDEASYQSKTTIAKTASGVRITIDIFFDKDRSMEPSDVVGSRVETDIPKSRILAEFQQQANQATS